MKVTYFEGTLRNGTFTADHASEEEGANADGTYTSDAVRRDKLSGTLTRELVKSDKGFAIDLHDMNSAWNCDETNVTDVYCVRECGGHMKVVSIQD